MKNQYMFFAEQLFDGIDLSEYNKADTRIPKTNVHIYEFECVETDICCDDESKAIKLDELTQRLENAFPESFQIVNSESSQHFCSQIYPLVVKFETKLRYALYISRALFENGNVDKTSFMYEVEKKKKPIEEMDFGVIYESIFTDKDLKGALHREYSSSLTKADLLKIVSRLEEKTMWHDWVGTNYSYIEKHFLEIKDFRNDVMHNHLIGYTEYAEAKNVLQKAINELDRAISDKLLTNQSEYLNEVNVINVISSIIKALGIAAIRLNQAANSDYAKNLIKAFALLGAGMISTQLQEARDEIEKNPEADNNEIGSDSSDDFEYQTIQ